MSSRAVQVIPDYLQPYIVQQDPSLYTAIDQASWRFILKLSRIFFKDRAHQKYLDGLAETGISTERIPLISEMNEKLARFGWQAAAVSGFIPPGVFMEFLSIGVLPIACDMRKIENLAYTPAPDIVHEAAGHAPIIADPEFAKYLLNYGELARKAIFSSQDMDVYNAIRHLSDTKESPESTPEEIKEAEDRLSHASEAVKYDSEATQLSRMAWWTFEYGLVGDLANPKIYGAGLLSSMSESFHCLGKEVRKVPFSLDCVHQTFDITRPQPQLYVARDFQQLSDALDNLGQSMAFRKGGIFGLDRAKKAATVTTTEFDSGVQVSGVLSDFIIGDREPAYLMFKGPTQISFGDHQLPGQGADYHVEGFGTPIGLTSDGKSPATLTETHLESYGFGAGKRGILKFKSGVEITGLLKAVTREKMTTQVITFTDCTVRLGDRVLFEPSWGTFDMACGARIKSVFGGAADRKEYLSITGGFHQEPRKPKTNLTAKNRKLNDLYLELRSIRERLASRKFVDVEGVTILLKDWVDLSTRLDQESPQDWLLRYEMLEMAEKDEENLEGIHCEPLKEFIETTRKKLIEIAQDDKIPGRPNAELIKRGLEAI